MFLLFLCLEEQYWFPYYCYPFFVIVIVTIIVTLDVIRIIIRSIWVMVIQLRQTSLRRLQDVLKRSRRFTTKQDIITTSRKRRRIYNVLKTPDLCRLEEVQFTTSWRRLRHFQDVWFTTLWRRLIYVVLKTSNLRRLEDVWFTTSWGRLIYDVLKTSDLCCLEDVQFMTPWRRLIYDVLRTSVKRHLCSNVVAQSIQPRKKWLFLISYCLKYSENFKCFSLS